MHSAMRVLEEDASYVVFLLFVLTISTLPVVSTDSLLPAVNDGGTAGLERSMNQSALGSRTLVIALVTSARFMDHSE